MPLQHRTDLEQLTDVLVRPDGHPGAAARQMLDQTLLHQQPQRFAQRRPADREPLADLLFDQSGAGLEGAAEDLVAQPAGGRLDQARREQIHLSR